MIYFLGGRKEIEECSGKVAQKYGSKADSACDLVRGVSPLKCIKVRIQDLCRVQFQKCRKDFRVSAECEVIFHHMNEEGTLDCYTLNAYVLLRSKLWTILAHFVTVAKLTGQGMICVITAVAFGYYIAINMSEK